MRCAGCGQPLTEGVSVCLRCGTPAPRDLTPKPVEVAVMPDPVLPSGDNWPSLEAPSTSPYGQLASANPPPPPLYGSTGELGMSPYPNSGPQERPRIRFTFVSVLLLTVLAAGSFGAYNFAHAAGWLGRAANHTGGAVGISTSPAPTQCVLPTVDPAAKYNLTDVQLTSGLKDENHKDYRPVNDVNIFHVGNSIYVTFLVASNASADLKAEWCWGSGQTTNYELNLIHNSGVNGYFKLSNVDPSAIGRGAIVIRWNDTVAAAIPFTVER